MQKNCANPISFFSLVLGIILALSSCQKNPLTDPYSYTAFSGDSAWQVSKEEKRKIRSVVLGDIIEIKDSNEVYSLGQLFDLSLHYNPSTSETWQRAREAAAEYGSSLSSYFPSLAIEGGVNSIRSGFIFNSQSLLVNQQTAYGPIASIHYMIWDSGERSANAEAFYQALQGANFAHNQQMQSVLRDTASAYYDYLYEKAYLKALEADLLDTEATYDAAMRKLGSGIFSSTDMLQAKTNYLKTRVAVTGQENAVKNSYLSLLKVLGIPQHAKLQLGCFPRVAPKSPFDPDPEKLVELAKQFRPDYLSAKTAVLADQARVKKAKTELMPKLNLQGTGGMLWYNGGFHDEGNYNIMLSLKIPIFSGFYYLNQIRSEESELRASVAKLREQEVTISQQVRSYANNHEMAVKKLADTKSYLEAAEIEFDAMLKRYKEGIVNILDVLSSQSFLSDARAQYISAEKIYYESLIDIAFATGLLTNANPESIKECKCGSS